MPKAASFVALESRLAGCSAAGAAPVAAAGVSVAIAGR
jgi:hypothetical protein